MLLSARVPENVIRPALRTGMPDSISQDVSACNISRFASRYQGHPDTIFERNVPKSRHVMIIGLFEACWLQMEGAK
eukprot:scaffold78658_cov18-Tisochrysis_lutea.AAC.1